jgi:uncharacterized membrane protein YgcG
MAINILKYVKQFASYIFYASMTVFAVLILIKLTGYFVSSARAERLVTAASAFAQTNTDENRGLPAKSREIAESLKKKNLFVPAVQKQNPVSQVNGIFGSEALINGAWYREGDKIQDAQIVAIEPAKVKIKWQDEVRTYEPITSSSPTGGGPMQARAGGESRPTPSPARSTVIQGQPDRGFGRFGGFSEEQMAQMREARQRFENMSESERQQMFNQMREGMGGMGGFGGMGGPGGRGPRGGGSGGSEGSSSEGGGPGGGRGGRGNRGGGD